MLMPCYYSVAVITRRPTMNEIYQEVDGEPREVDYLTIDGERLPMIQFTDNEAWIYFEDVGHETQKESR